MQTKRICIIPARGGSKRIPRKNIKNFCGKPIIAYSIETALKSKLFDTVMVSTDDEEIIQLALNLGAEVPFIRSSKNSDDYATTVDVIEEVLGLYKYQKGIEFNEGCCLYPCAPLIELNKFKELQAKLEAEKLDSVFPICEYPTPIKRALKKNDDNSIGLYFKKNEFQRSQDTEKAYFDAGQYYWFNVNSLLKQKSLYMLKTNGIEISTMRTQDIDNEADWTLAEMKFKSFTNK